MKAKFPRKGRDSGKERTVGREKKRRNDSGPSDRIPDDTS